MAKKAPPGFNTPFRGLKPPAAPPVAAPAPAKASLKHAAPAARTASAPSDDDRLFEQAMRGVTPLSSAERSRRAAPAGAPAVAPSRATLRARARREDALADADLVELVAKPGHLTIEENGESMFGFGAGVDRRLLRRLGAGDYPIDAELDLHGLRRDAAIAALERAIKHARAAGQRCLLVIHGRGLNSGDEGPVLKRTVAEALADGALSRLVLAFASAPPSAGGPGATLVLLRKPSR
ncbi:MAG TPA: Smr/MutS family protein [Polyangia bacterium]|jgi:DNA-nicking Smr family endonuclease|nr:Smr/MutS family protein [Polyangia bacterium]